MASSEVGHTKNIANFGILIVYCTGYGIQYNPSKLTLKIIALTTKKTTSTSLQAAVNLLIPPFDTATDNRDILFKPFSKLVTKIHNAVKSSDVTPGFIKDVTTLTRKLQGIRATPRQRDNPETPIDESLNSHSASQMSFDFRIENFERLIDLLLSNPGYAPNEDELKVASLQALHASMVLANKAVIDANTPLSNARIARNVELYHIVTGLVQVSIEVKAYVKSVFGGRSAQYKQVSKLKFTRPKQD